MTGDSIIVFAADHGEALGKNDYWFAHGEYLSDNLIRVPLFIHVPEGAVGVRDDVTSLMDLFPTLLSLLGVSPRKEYTGPGRDLFAPGARSDSSTIYLATLGGSSVPRVGLIAHEHKLVLSRKRRGSFAPAEQLFRLGGEIRNLSGLARLRALLMRRRINTIRHALIRRVASSQQLSADEREQLRALGYAFD